MRTPKTFVKKSREESLKHFWKKSIKESRVESLEKSGGIPETISEEISLAIPGGTSERKPGMNSWRNLCQLVLVKSVT